MAALTGHGGESRVILTSRISPAGLADSVPPLPVHALDLAEAAALARELPGLRSLLHADAGPVRAAETAVAADRDLVRRVLHVVQGHPKLMELADAAATARPARLTAQLDAAETAAGGQMLDAFFRDGTTALAAAQFLDALATWTTTTLDGLSGPARLMAQFLACLEDDDRQAFIIEPTLRTAARSKPSPRRCWPGTPARRGMRRRGRSWINGLSACWPPPTRPKWNR